MAKPGQWLTEIPENDSHINWHDVGVASLTLLGMVTCAAVLVVAPWGGFIALCCIVGCETGAAVIIFPLGVSVAAVLLEELLMSKLDDLSPIVGDNETVKQALHGPDGLVQRLVSKGDLTQTDLASLNKAYEELKGVSQTKGMQKFSAFNPNSHAMAEVLRHLLSSNEPYIVNATIKLINRIASELTRATREEIFGNCFPHMQTKTADQVICFFQAFPLNTLSRSKYILDAISHPDNILVCKLTKVDAQSVQDLLAILKRYPDVAQMLLNGDLTGLNLGAIKLLVGIMHYPNTKDILAQLLGKLDGISAEMVRKVLLMNDSNGDWLVKILFSIIPEGRKLAYKIFENLKIDNLLVQKNKTGNPLIASLFSACGTDDQRTQFINFIATLSPEKQVQLFAEKDRTGDPFIFSLLTACCGVPQQEQLLNLLGQLPPGPLVSLFAERNCDGQSLIESLSAHVVNLSCGMRLMELLIMLKKNNKIEELDSLHANMDPTLNRMFKIIGANPPEGYEENSAHKVD